MVMHVPSGTMKVDGLRGDLINVGSSSGLLRFTSIQQAISLNRPGGVILSKHIRCDGCLWDWALMAGLSGCVEYDARDVERVGR